MDLLKQKQTTIVMFCIKIMPPYMGFVMQQDQRFPYGNNLKSTGLVVIRL